MAKTQSDGTTKRDSNSELIKEKGLPKDRETAEAGDNRRGNDVDGNRAATRPKVRKG